MSNFIRLNHGLIDMNHIIGVSDIFWSETEVKPRKDTKKKNTLGPIKNKTKKSWGFCVFTLNNKITVYPTSSNFNYSSNSRKLVIKKHEEFLDRVRIMNH